MAMGQADTIEAPARERYDLPARERYDSLAHFYNADERRTSSRELDVGLWWREKLDGPLHRAAWVSDTGELYLVRLGHPDEGGGAVEVLARFADRALLDCMLDGWRERCGEPRSLEWLRERAALRFRVSAGSARVRPREAAPTVRPSRRTGGTAVGCQDRGRASPGAPRPADLQTGLR
jgi:hypothetical protein